MSQQPVHGCAAWGLPHWTSQQPIHQKSHCILLIINHTSCTCTPSSLLPTRHSPTVPTHWWELWWSAFFYDVLFHTLYSSLTVPSQRSSPVNIDNHPESVVRVEASNVHALFNFLLTSKTTITTTGAHAGIPPTLIAPVAYEGSTLKSLTVCYYLFVLLYKLCEGLQGWQVFIIDWYSFHTCIFRQGKAQCTNMLVGNWCNSTHWTSVDPFFLKPYTTSAVSSNKHNTATLWCIQPLLCPLVASMLLQRNLQLSLLLFHPWLANSITISLWNQSLKKVDWRKCLARMIAIPGTKD